MHEPQRPHLVTLNFINFSCLVIQISIEIQYSMTTKKLEVIKK